MDTISTAYVSIADLNLWVKAITNEPLTIADVPKILRHRYQYILDNWVSIKILVESRIEAYIDTNRIRLELISFDNIVNIEASKINKLKTNESQLMSKYYTIFDTIFISDIPITKQEQALIDGEVNRVTKFTKTDFLKLRENLVAGRDAVADNTSGTDEDYNRVYRRSPLVSLLDKNIPDIVMSASMQDVIGTLDHILANSSQLGNSTATLDPFAFARSNANNPDIDIRSYNSGRLTKINYGETLQKLAQRTLGDETRWMEIAIANGLKPPYIDEVGETIFLVSNGKNNQINIAPLDVNGNRNMEKLYMGQIIFIQSSSQKIPEQRIISSVKGIPISGEIVLELDGLPDLNKFLKNDNATIRVYQKNTINSNFFILIPTNDQLDVKADQDTPWFLRSKGEDEKKVGVDFAVNNDGDIQFTAFGDVALAYAMENATQAVRLKIETAIGDLSKHPEFGIDSSIGSIKGSKVKAAVTESINKQILSDGRFERLDYMTVQSISNESASGYLVKLGVVLAGSTTVIPISFSINKT